MLFCSTELPKVKECDASEADSGNVVKFINQLLFVQEFLGF